MRSRVSSIASKIWGTLVYIIRDSRSYHESLKRRPTIARRRETSAALVSPRRILRARLPAQIQPVPALESIDRFIRIDADVRRLKVDGLIFGPQEAGDGVEGDGRAARL